MPLYEERQVLIVTSELLAASATSIGLAEAVQLPLCLLNSGMRGRQVLDRALQSRALSVSPQLETDSVAALYAHVATGRWASIVPDPWTRTMPPPVGVRVLELTDPVVHSPIGLVTASLDPGSVLTRALVATAESLHLDELFGLAIAD